MAHDVVRYHRSVTTWQEVIMINTREKEKKRKKEKKRIDTIFVSPFISTVDQLDVLIYAQLVPC